MSVAGTTSILLMEDQIIIAMDVEDILHGAGFDRIETVSSCRAAEEWLTANDPDVVVSESTEARTIGVSGNLISATGFETLRLVTRGGGDVIDDPSGFATVVGVWNPQSSD
jgi:AmiR/NasT family two-component response regulator